MSPIRYGNAAFEIWFDLIAPKLVQQVSDGSRKTLPPTARPVADLSRDFVHLLQGEPGDWPELSNGDLLFAGFVEGIECAKKRNFNNIQSDR